MVIIKKVIWDRQPGAFSADAQKPYLHQSVFLAFILSHFPRKNSHSCRWHGLPQAASNQFGKLNPAGRISLLSH
jgi:hypothetical protein